MTCTQCGCSDNRTLTGRKLCNRCVQLKSKYGISHQMYSELLKKQDYRCAICQSKDPLNTFQSDKFCVDHCHKTGEVRGLLCNHCNRGIGLFNDSVENLLKAALYLQNHAKRDDESD